MAAGPVLPGRLATAPLHSGSPCSQGSHPAHLHLAALELCKQVASPGTPATFPLRTSSFSSLLSTGKHLLFFFKWTRYRCPPPILLLLTHLYNPLACWEGRRPSDRSPPSPRCRRSDRAHSSFHRPRPSRFGGGEQHPNPGAIPGTPSQRPTERSRSPQPACVRLRGVTCCCAGRRGTGLWGKDRGC